MSRKTIIRLWDIFMGQQKRQGTFRECGLTINRALPAPLGFWKLGVLTC